MQNFLISLNDIPPSGRTVTLEDSAVWAQPLEEFHMDCRAVAPLRAELFLLPAEGGCLVRGTLTGTVAVPCDRCAEDTEFSLNHSFETFESLPESLPAPGEDGEDVLEEDDSPYIAFVQGVPMLDLAALCWEEFVLALPVKPLCSPDCKGLCASCGANLNHGACGCAKETGDPRLSALRAFKVKTPGN